MGAQVDHRPGSLRLEPRHTMASICDISFGVVHWPECLERREVLGEVVCEVQLSSKTLTVSTCCCKAAILPSRMVHT